MVTASHLIEAAIPARVREAVEARGKLLIARRRSKRIADSLVEPEVTDNDPGPRNSWTARWSEDAYVSYISRNNNLVLYVMVADATTRGREMLRWLTAHYGVPIDVIEVEPNTQGFWEKMKAELMIRSWKPLNFRSGQLNPLLRESARQVVEAEVRDDYYAAESYIDLVRSQLDDIVDSFLRHKGPGRWLVPWSKLPSARLKKIWLDYGKSGVIRDARGMQDIADQMARLIARLDQCNAIAGHDRYDPIDSYEDPASGDPVEFTPEQREALVDGMEDKDGHWFVSDYGLEPLRACAQQILRATTSEEQLHAVDRALNIVHQRGDLADHFIDGGSSTLQAIADQGGYEASDKPEWGWKRNEWAAKGGTQQATSDDHSATQHEGLADTQLSDDPLPNNWDSHATDSGWIGTVVDGTTTPVRAGNLANTSHSLHNMEHGARWRYRDSNETVYWWEWPSEADEWTVEQALNRRGYGVERHVDICTAEAPTRVREAAALREGADQLAAEFIGKPDRFWGITSDKRMGDTFPSGQSAVECTGYALAIKSKLGDRAKVYGFYGEDNPTSEIGKDAGGHDFAVVDGRYIVDPWLTDVWGGKKGVFDLENPDDQPEIKRLYGDRATWSAGVQEEPPRSFEGLLEGQSQRVLARFTFHELLDSGLNTAVFPATLTPETRPDCRRSGKWRITVYDYSPEPPYELDALFHVNIRSDERPSLEYIRRKYGKDMLAGLENTRGAIGGYPTAVELSPGYQQESQGSVFHVTYTDKIPAIRQHGLRMFQTTNWSKGEKGGRYGQGGIYSFENIDDAVRWAAKMDWEFNQRMGTGKISVIRVRDTSGWDADENDPLGQAGAKGRWLTRMSGVKPDGLGEAVPVTSDMIRKLNSPSGVTEEDVFG